VLCNENACYNLLYNPFWMWGISGVVDMKTTIIIILAIILMGIVGYIGWVIGSSGVSHSARIEGVWLKDLSSLNQYEGRFICINVLETKDLKELASTCIHEAAHEVWAVECENDIDKCLEDIK